MKKEIFKKGLGTRGIGLVLLRPLSKKKKKKFHQSYFFKFLQKFKISKIFKKKFKIFNSFEKFKFSKFKKKSSLNFSSGTESYDPLSYFSVVQHQVNCSPSAFFEA